MKPEKITGKIVKKQYLTSDILDINILLDIEIEFKSGQFINIEVSPNIYRSYSIYSKSGKTREISIVLKILDDGVGSNFFHDIKVNSQLNIIGPSGRFTLEEELLDKNPNLVFISTSTGIAPFISMLDYLDQIDFKGNINLYFGLRNKEDIFFIEHLEYFTSKLNFNYYICLSQEHMDIKVIEEQYLSKYPNIKFKSGRITQYINSNVNGDNTLYLVCGKKDMVEEVNTLLLDNNITSNQIRYEKY